MKGYGWCVPIIIVPKTVHPSIQCSTTSITKDMACIVQSVRWSMHIKDLFKSGSQFCADSRLLAIISVVCLLLIRNPTPKNPHTPKKHMQKQKQKPLTDSEHQVLIVSLNSSALLTSLANGKSSAICFILFYLKKIFFKITIAKWLDFLDLRNGSKFSLHAFDPSTCVSQTS